MNVKFRPVLVDDFLQIKRLTSLIGPGMGSAIKLPDKKLKTLLLYSSQCFTRIVKTPHNEFYLFVLQDINSCKLYGLCGIGASYNKGAGNYVFRVNSDSLLLQKAFLNCSFFNSLFVDPDYRGAGLGNLLSNKRLEYIKNNKNRFHSTVIGEIRGLADTRSYPFWTGLNLGDLTPSDHNFLIQSGLEQEIVAKIPKNKIPISELSISAQKAIKKIHTEAMPNLKMLLEIGFRYTEFVSISTGGPYVELKLDQI